MLFYQKKIKNKKNNLEDMTMLSTTMRKPYFPYKYNDALQMP